MSQSRPLAALPALNQNHFPPPTDINADRSEEICATRVAAPQRATSSSPFKRQRSDTSIHIHLSAPILPMMQSPDSQPIPLLSPIICATAEEVYMLDPSPSDLAPPSPTGTEIVIEGVKKEFDQALLPLILEAEGIKVRDYGAEVIPSDPRDPEMWDYPIQALVRHDVHIRRNPSNKNPMNLSGKTLWRLLDSGLVTQEEAVHNWTAEDWQAMNAYKTRPSGPSPYQVCNLVRPTASYREHMRLDFVPPLKDDKQEHEIFVPPDVPGMDEGDAVGRPHYAPKDWEEKYDSKKRKPGASQLIKTDMSYAAALVKERYHGIVFGGELLAAQAVHPSFFVGDPAGVGIVRLLVKYSMGLSGRKIKQRIPNDPRNLSWANDASKFGTSYLQKFGWDSSVGLGPSGEGRTTHISVHQKLDMLGIGADHRNSEDGTAWKQGRDFENLLRRLNDSMGNEDSSEAIKVDGFIRPSSTTEPAEDDAVPPSKASDEDDGDKLKRRKRKHGKDRDAVDEEETEKGKKKRKKSKTTDDGEPNGEERRKEKKKTKAMSSGQGEELPARSKRPSQDGLHDVVATPAVAPLVVPRPHRAHRARHIASKGLASKSATAISEILGVASSTTTPPSTSTPILSAVDTPVADASSSSDLKLQDLTTSTKSVMDYFREKLAAKSSGASSSTAAPSPSSPEINDYDDRPKVGLGASKLHQTTTDADDDGDRPRGGLGSSKANTMMGLPIFAAAGTNPSAAADEADNQDIDEGSKERRLKEKRKKKTQERSDETLRPASETAADMDADPGTSKKEKSKKKHRKKALEQPDDNQEVVSAADGTDVLQGQSGRKREKSKKRERGDKKASA
ncbi:hypothetical protein POSPLADRAFT_1046131 [Postia placenta MAD-698-R-SB12]|uniref:PinX1-related protein 1 n=1 Tax=Postia placenta MAD-698-R-SB12 TaxID=670580 RepID=A0A1X6N278_9APHY|nr:hypothetical protein POSPLADRAFT_1046131 [Postia placenta MAD-698-R-SB12]OSX62725.1 hypothetical protein POSPLADRAFT_1046131 [Postia placenta MAD-698-R-SB12]